MGQLDQPNETIVNYIWHRNDNISVMKYYYLQPMFTVTVRNPYSSLVGLVRYQMVGPTMCWYTSIRVQSNEGEDEDENK